MRLSSVLSRTKHFRQAAWRSAGLSEQPEAQAVARDLCELLMRGVPIDFVAGTAAAAATAWVIRAQLPARSLAVWLGLFVAAHAARLATWAAMRSVSALREHPRAALQLARLGVLGVGTAWAILPALLLPPGALDALFVAMVVCAVSGAGMAEYSVDSPAALLFVLPMLGALIGHLLDSHYPRLRDAGILAALYLLYLLFTTTRMHAQFQRITLHRAQAAAQLARDPLTGLGSRLDLDGRLSDALARARRQGTEVAVGYIDLDRFKLVNDAHGHATGDALLRELAARWRDELRASEVLARLGGDEFALVIEDLDPDLASHSIDAVVERLRGAVAHPFDVAGHALRVGMTVGVSRFPHDATEARALLHLADAAMYRGKKSPDAQRSWWPAGECVLADPRAA